MFKKSKIYIGTLLIAIATLPVQLNAEELLRDRGFAHGFYDNTGQGSKCSFPSTSGNSSWRFIDVAVNGNFCDHAANEPDNTKIRNAYNSFKGIKMFATSRDGYITMNVNTGEEWGWGCNMVPTIYPDGQNHPHHYVGQPLAGTRTNITAEERSRLQLDRDMTFKLKRKLKHIDSNGGECNDKYKPLHFSNTKNHAILSVTFLIVHENFDTLNAGSVDRMFLHAKLGYKGDAEGEAEWQGYEMIKNSVVYHSPLSEYGTKFPDSDFKNVEVDVRALAERAIRKEQEKRASDPYHRIHSYTVDHYYVGEVLLGWELWGGYNAGAEFDDIMLYR